MYAVLFAGLLFLNLNSLAQNTDSPSQNSGFVPSSENYNDTNAFERNPSAVDPRSAGDPSDPNGDQTDDESEKVRTPTNSQNMPVDQD